MKNFDFGKIITLLEQLKPYAKKYNFNTNNYEAYK